MVWIGEPKTHMEGQNSRTREFATLAFLVSHQRVGCASDIMGGLTPRTPLRVRPLVSNEITGGTPRVFAVAFRPSELIRARDGSCQAGAVLIGDEVALRYLLANDWEFRVTQASGRQEEALRGFRGPGGAAAGANGPRVSGTEARGVVPPGLPAGAAQVRAPRRAGLGALAAARCGRGGGRGRTSAGAGRALRPVGQRGGGCARTAVARGAQRARG
ncbi:unnamed protein product [Rangifer tarandus platyrhynchus]|uniref:Uncharacterized protein n=1 Tax=Rangifer tarandus platyrhynchus TaxID=3082113 RepID=A0ABN8YNF2_RANTA|nr:unnamed protein product [Rangifer tarandus platyrhynchus]